jgi:hypothetical protein
MQNVGEIRLTAEQALLALQIAPGRLRDILFGGFARPAGRSLLAGKIP